MENIENVDRVSRDVIIANGTLVHDATIMGQRLRYRRKELGYTQRQVAEFLGFSPRLIGEIENGRGSVGFDRILAYATGLGIDLVAFER